MEKIDFYINSILAVIYLTISIYDKQTLFNLIHNFNHYISFIILIQSPLY
jgi:hypothetical protein